MLCSECKINFEHTPEDFAFYAKLQVPPPLACPDCRLQQRLAFRNERHLYKRTCDLTGKSIISIYRPDSQYKVYDQTEWLTGEWDALEYGRDFNFSRPFFEQFQELLRAVPHPAVGYRFQSENCEYTTYQNHSRNCYLCFGSGYMEDCAYTNWTYYAKNSFDALGCANVELSYETVDCKRAYNSNFCQDCSGITDCAYCYNCHSCKNCFGCVNLKNKEFCFLNQQFTKEEYFEKIRTLDNVKFLSEFENLLAQSPRRAHLQLNCEDCTGDHLLNCKNVHDSFYADDCRDGRFHLDVLKNTDCYDCTRTGEDELSYQCIGGGDYYFNRFFVAGERCSYSTYCLFCFNSKNLFGCVGIKRKEYCILNKQYSKEEYEDLVPRIIEYMTNNSEWGEFFPMTISPFSYEESLASDYFPHAI